MDDNLRTAIGYICIALVLIIWILGAAWIMSPQEFTFKFEIDNNTKEAVESVEYPIINENQKINHANFSKYVSVCRIFNDSTADCGVGGALDPDVIEIYGDCEYKWIFAKEVDDE